METANFDDNMEATEVASGKEKTSHISFQTTNWRGSCILYQYNGFWFTPPRFQATMNIVDNHKPLPNDIILASFPKTGTTWLKAILYSIVHRSNKTSKLANEHPHELVPSLEFQVYNESLQAPCELPSSEDSSARIYSTHIPFQILGDAINSTDCRVVYVTRNPKDTLISFLKFMQTSEEHPPWPLDEAVDEFCNGTVPFGPYYEHVLGYWKESLERPDKFFFLTYEGLKDDPKSVVERLAAFLGCPFVEESDQQVEEIVSNCSFERLTSYEVNKSSDLPTWIFTPYNAFYRQGKVGDSKNYLNEEMIKKIDAVTMEKFHGSGFSYGV